MPLQAVHVDALELEADRGGGHAAERKRAEAGLLGGLSARLARPALTHSLASGPSPTQTRIRTESPPATQSLSAGDAPSPRCGRCVGGPP